MNKEQHFSIGKFAGTHSLKGELVLKHALGKRTSLKGLTTIFVKDKNGSILPWFIEAARIKNNEEVFVKLEGIDTKEEARSLVQKEVWLAETDFKKHAAKTSAISLLGFTVVDGENTLGTIEEIIEQPHQILCRLEVQGKEVLIPLHEETLKKIDQKNNIVSVELPDGLLDIYLT